MRINQISDYFYKEVQPFIKGEYLSKIKEYLEQNSVSFIDTSFEPSLSAIIHRSFKNENEIELDQNEKLEFLGDSVLQIIVSEKLFKIFPDKKEGDLSKLRSALVNEDSLSKLALANGLESYILLGKGEFKEQGFLKPSILSDCFEAVLGSIYLREGLDGAKNFLDDAIKVFEKKNNQDFYNERVVSDFDAKSKLQELVMKKYKVHPQYDCSEKEIKGKKQFYIQFKIEEKVIAETMNPSKKKGMQLLAKEILENKLI